MAGFALVYLLLSFVLTDMRVRYVAPIIPPLVLLSVFGMDGLLVAFRNSTAAAPRRWGPVGLFAVLTVLLALNGVYIRDRWGGCSR